MSIVEHVFEWEVQIGLRLGWSAPRPSQPFFGNVCKPAHVFDKWCHTNILSVLVSWSMSSIWSTPVNGLYGRWTYSPQWSAAFWTYFPGIWRPSMAIWAKAGNHEPFWNSGEIGISTRPIYVIEVAYSRKMNLLTTFGFILAVNYATR